ncbi:MAG TPA: response regulator transcription factor [Candidatus Nesterenkonia stercoripullorum]|uniref:Response regulator transcription factor n=1 Tax=Candidatus Nesterenkonia stercoripullorum TaxID=2838701 RepID=A0A9D1UV59_9MICC|nr:response regulator transcription factor [Candidatus Nesterenkonia stercoripullorum]
MPDRTVPEGGVIRVVLVDDQKLMRDGIATILGNDPGIDVVGSAADGAAALEVVTSTSPDVVCMDVEMPVMDGIEATRRICAAPGSPQVIMLTTFDREDYLLRALQAGAVGFLLKTGSPEQLIAGIRTVAEGEGLLAPEMTRALIRHAVESLESQPDAAASAVDDLLSARERDVLVQVAKGLSNTEIAEQLFISAATVKTHISHVLTKLDLRNRAQAVAYAYESGLMEQG